MKSIASRIFCSSLALLLFGCSSIHLPVVSQPIGYTYSEWSVPVNLGNTVNTASNDQHPAISPDGLTLYFHSDRSGAIDGSLAGTSDLWVSKRPSTTSAWVTPTNLGPTVNSIYNDTAPAFSPDGLSLYFGSERPGGCGGSDIWVVHRTDASVDTGTGGWGTPANLGCSLDSSVFEDGPTYFVNPDTQKATLYFTSLNRPGGQGDWDIMKSEQQLDGTWSTPVFVTELNANDRDTRTAMRYDGLELFVTSRRAGSLTDSTGANTLDLWVSTRNNLGAAWGTPVSLGPTINSSSNDGAPALSKDATELIFYSNKTGGFGANDLYVSHRTRTPVYPMTQ